jgi:hypothetical protein
VRCIAINDSYLVASWADVLYFADSEWHAWHSKGIAKPRLKLSAGQVSERFGRFAGAKCTIRNTGMNVKDPNVHMLRNAHGDIHGWGLSLDAHSLVTGRNSGFQALNLAVLAGGNPIILLGFDAREPDGPNWQSHFHGDHPRIEPIHVYEQYRRSFSSAEDALKEAGVRVLNCSPGSAINAFPRMSLAEALG